MGLPAELPKVIIDLKCQLQPNNEPWVKEAALKRIINFFPEPSLRPGRDSPDQIRTVKKIIDGGIVPLIKMNVISGNRNLVLLALEVLQNLTAGTLEQLHAVVDDELWHQFSRFLGIPRMPTSHQDKTPTISVLEQICDTCMRKGDQDFPNRTLELVEQLLSFEQSTALTLMNRVCTHCNKNFNFNQDILKRLFPRLISLLDAFNESVNWNIGREICLPMKYLAYDKDIAQMAFEADLLPRLIRLLDVDHGHQEEVVLMILNWLAKFYPKQVVEACRPAPNGADFHARVTKMTMSNRWPVYGHILAILSIFIKQGYAQDVADAGWFPYLIEVGQQSHSRKLRNMGHENSQNEPMQDGFGSGYDDDLEFPACHLIAELILDKLYMSPAEIAECVNQGAIPLLCRYLQHESNATVASCGRPPKRRATENDDESEYDFQEYRSLVSSPLLALMGIFTLGELGRFQRRLPANDYGEMILDAGGLAGAKIFLQSQDQDIRDHASIFVTQLVSYQELMS